MRLNYFRIFKGLFISAYLLTLYFYLRIYFQPELFYHNQQPSFISDWGFFTSFLNYPGGIAQYLSNFICQFFYFGWAGSLVILFTGSLFMLSGWFIFKSYKAPVSGYFWMFIPLILFIALLNNYLFPFAVVIKILFVFLSLWLFRYTQQRNINFYLIFLFLAPLVYYLSGSGSLEIFSASVLISQFFGKIKIAKLILFLMFVGLFTYLFEIISYKYIFYISSDEKSFSLIPNTPDFLRYRPDLLFYIFCLALPFISLLLVLYQKLTPFIFKGKKDLRNEYPIIYAIVYILALVLIIRLSYSTFKSTYDLHKKNVILTDYYCYYGNWDKTISVALADPQYEIFINLNYNRAVDNNGHYLDEFFNYPQFMGIDALYPDKISAPELAETSSDYYFDLGYISESQHWAHEALTVFPNSIRALERLVITNLIFENFNAAKAYLGVLDKNFIAKEFVKKYQSYISDTSLATKDSVILAKRSFLPGTVHLSNKITNRFYDLINKNPNNQRAFEHLQISAMLEHDLGLFMTNLAGATKFYKNIPPIYEQAIMMYLRMTKLQSGNQYNLSISSQQTFMGFLRTMRDFNNNREYAKPSMESYSGTYMYYVTYNSPVVTKAELTKKIEQNY